MSNAFIPLMFHNTTPFLSFGVFLILLYNYFLNNPGCKTSLKFRFLPKYKELISKHNAKYPCVMDCICTRDTSFHNLKGIFNLKSYIFIKDESFVIISTANPDIYVKIPFSSIIYHNSYFHTIDAGKTHKYCFRLFFKSNDKIEQLDFDTIYYNHKLCKKYPDLLCDDQLFDFVCQNFKTHKEHYGW